MQCPKDELLGVMKEWPVRTEAMQKENYDKICQAPTKTQRDQLSSALSTQPVPSGVWNWGGSLRPTNFS